MPDFRWLPVQELRPGDQVLDAQALPSRMTQTRQQGGDTHGQLCNAQGVPATLAASHDVRVAVL